MFCFYFRAQQQQLLEYLERRASFVPWDALESHPGPCSPPGRETQGAQRGGTLLQAPARKQGMGWEGRTFKRGQRCDENKQATHVCAPRRRLRHEVREHGRSLGSRGGGSFVGMEGGVQSYRAQGLAQLLLTVPTSEYPPFTRGPVRTPGAARARGRVCQ